MAKIDTDYTTPQNKFFNAILSRLTEDGDEQTAAAFLELYSICRAKVAEVFPDDTEPEKAQKATKILIVTIRELEIEMKQLANDYLADLQQGQIMDDAKLQAKHDKLQNRAIKLAFKELFGISIKMQAGRKEELTGREIAASEGALIDINDRLVSPSTRETIKRMRTHNYYLLPGARAAERGAFSSTGNLNTSLISAEELMKIKSVNTGMLLFFITLVYETLDNLGVQDDGKSTTIKIYVPAMIEALKIDPRPFSKERGETDLRQLRAQKCLDLMNVFQNILGIDAHGNYKILLSIQEYDSEKEIITCTSPFLFSLARQLRASNKRKPTVHKLMHTDAAKEDRAALEIANYILSVIVAKGKNETAEISCKKIITECPNLKYELDIIRAERSEGWRKKYTMKLKRRFEQAFTILLDKSDLKERYYIRSIEPAKARKKPNEEIRPGHIITPTYSTKDTFKYTIKCTPIKGRDGEKKK